jgi:hypothetical protein
MNGWGFRERRGPEDEREEMTMTALPVRARTAATLIAAFATFAISATNASAVNPAGALAFGSGSISPGLTIVPTAQSISFGGTLAGGGAVAGSAVVANDSCSVTAISNITETIAQGDGNASGSCSGTTALTASLHYQRVGSVVVMTGTGTVNGVAVTLAMHCEFEPTSAPTVTSYELQCAIAGA